VVLATLALEQRAYRKSAEAAPTTEYTEMMSSARSTATERMKARAAELGADAIINVRYMTTSVIGSAAELLVYGTAVRLSEP